MKEFNGKPAAFIADRYNLKLLAKPILSPSGMFMFFIGHHYNGKEECYDVCAAKMTVRPIKVTRRHHHKKEEALITWEETVKRLQKMEEKPNETDGERLIVN